MQTLILTSSGKYITTHNVDQYLPKKIVECKIAYIITASKKVDDTTYIDDHRKKMNSLGFHYTEIDIAGKDTATVRRELTGYDIVMVEGGNTFYLLQAVRACGFENIIRKLLAKGVVYIGSSAGTYIACPSIVMATWSDSGYDRCGITEFTGMNLVPFLVWVHYTVEKEKMLRDRADEYTYPINALRDDEALVVRDDEVLQIR